MKGILRWLALGCVVFLFIISVSVVLSADEKVETTENVKPEKAQEKAEVKAPEKAPKKALPSNWYDNLINEFGKNEDRQ